MSKEKKIFSIFNHPILTGIIATIVAFLGTQVLAIPFVIIGGIIADGDETLEESMIYLATAIGALLLILLISIIMKKKGFKGVFSFAKTNLKDVLIGFLVVNVVDILCLIYSATLLEHGLKSLVIPNFYTLALALAAGIGEETIFRAVPIAMMMKNKVDNKRIIVVVVLSSILFSLMHLSNMSEGAILSTTLVQVVACISTGILYAGIYLRSGSILLPMLAHFFHDYINFMLPAQATGIMTQTSFSAMEMIPEVVMFIVELGIGIYLLRKTNFEVIKNTWNNKWSK